MPVNDYSEYFGPTHTLQISPSNMENQNTPEYLEGVRNRLLENLSKIPPKPSVPFHDVPPDAIPLDAMEVKEDPDQKGGGAEAEGARRAHPSELEPDEGDKDDKPSRYDGPAVEEEKATGEGAENDEVEGSKKEGADVKAEETAPAAEVKTEGAEGAEGVHAAPGGATDAAPAAAAEATEGDAGAAVTVKSEGAEDAAAAAGGAELGGATAVATAATAGGDAMDVDAAHEGGAEGVLSDAPSRPSNAGPGIMANDHGEQ